MLSVINPTISLFALIGGSLAVALAGFVTMRANTAKIWRENYEAKSAALKESEEKHEAYREQKHTQVEELTTRLLQKESEIKILEAKTDITSIEHILKDQHKADQEILIQIRDGVFDLKESFNSRA